MRTLRRYKSVWRLVNLDKFDDINRIENIIHDHVRLVKAYYEPVQSQYCVFLLTKSSVRTLRTTKSFPSFQNMMKLVNSC
jgi:hypothetical protein